MSCSRIVVPGLPEFPASGHAAVAGGTVSVPGMLGLADDTLSRRPAPRRR